MTRRGILLMIFLMQMARAGAQDSLWTLEGSIQYALIHNIDIRQSTLNQRLAALQLKQSQLSQIPSVSASSNYGRSFGRSIDPTTNQFINAGYNFSGINANADVLLFGWFQKRKTIERDKLSLKAAKADWDQLQDDIALNVATGFLRVLLAGEQMKIAQKQVELSHNQRLQTAAFVQAGTKPALELLQLSAQVATDSATYFNALAEYNQSLLEIKALMNLDIGAPFVAVAPNVENPSIAEIASGSPEQIYEVAAANFGAIKSGQIQEEAARKSLAAYKAALYPQLSLGAQAGTNYSSALKEVTNPRLIGAEPNGTYVSVAGQNYPVYQPVYEFGQITTPFGKQLNNNFRQTVALSLVVPIFNGWTARNAIDQAKVDIANKELALEKSRVKLKQDVYAAWNNARVAVQKYYAATTAAKAAEKAVEFAQQRYELGLMNAVELLTTQNTGFKAQTDALSAKYDMIFKLKVIDYYLGKEIKL